VNNNAFDLYMMIGFGIAGYLLRKLSIPLVPIVLGLLLGSQMEFNLRRALSISGGDWSILATSGIALGIYALTALLLAVGVAVGIVRARRLERIGPLD
jgi:putative tricarboxylic transport membrane protein